MLYDIGFFIFSLIYLPTLVWKGKLNRDLLQRFGVYDRRTRARLDAGGSRIWIQAVSVGEVALCRTLVPLVQARFPGSEIVLSTVTKAGYDLAQQAFADTAIVIYFPLDFSFVVGRVVGRIRPRLYIMVETEIWPNCLTVLRRRGVPTVMVNGRISDRSIGRYRLVKPFMRRILAVIDAFCMQSAVDAERIISLGAPPERVTVTGNMKFDLAVPDRTQDLPAMGRRLALAPEDRLIIAGSTHEGEEAIIMRAFRTLTKTFPGLRLMIAPRHIDRVAAVEQAVKDAGFEPVRVSYLAGDKRVAAGGSKVLVLDTIGILNDLYALASVVIIGGSLVPHGGHNPIEPALYGKPVVFGPHMFNFKEVAAALLAQGSALGVAGEVELGEACARLLGDAVFAAAIGAKARATVTAHRGAAARNMEIIGRVVL